ncbi:MAG: hypothetical protein M1825_004056 [Sarcosagium campestre]|nr:MAG: hypothetical protein M1825_004056 [Sarcosagium campestre]
MDIHVDPRLRSGPSSAIHNSPQLPPISQTAASENPVRLPPPNRPRIPSPLSERSQSAYFDHPHTSKNHSEPTPGLIRNGTPEAAHDPKRPRACEACRGLKVRCEPNPDVNEPCKRCKKAGRRCIVTQPSRKRQKKTDSRVAELERKIDALTATLHAAKSETPESSSDDSQAETRDENSYNYLDMKRPSRSSASGPGQPSPDVTRTWPDATDKIHRRSADNSPTSQTLPSYPTTGHKRRRSMENGKLWAPSVSSVRGRGDGPLKGSIAQGSPSSSAENQPNAYAFLIPKETPSRSAPITPEVARASPQVSALIHDYADVIDRRLLSAELATAFFERYVNRMATIFPTVVFPKGTTAPEIRKNKPILFLAILSVSCGASHPDLQRTLTKEIMKSFADRIIVNGEKSLELVQALQVATTWYWPPEHFEELKFYQLIHIAAVMALDLGLGKKSRQFGKAPVSCVWREHPWRRNPPPDPESIECRRIWLNCYFGSSLVAQSLRRPNLIRWSPFLQECVDILEPSPDGHPSDREFCHWIRLQHIAEDVATQFSMDDSAARIGGIGDLKIQFAVKGFERQLEDWYGQRDKELLSPSLLLSAHVINLYIHEVAVHVDHNVDDFRPPFTETLLRGAQSQPGLLTAAHIGALSSCLDAIHGIFNAFLGFEIEYIRALPIFNFVRVAYGVIVLTKMHFAVIAPNSELGKIIGKDSLKIEHYLDSLVDRYRLAAEDDRCRAASKFMMILVMLKTWFNKSKAGGKAGMMGPCGQRDVRNGSAAPTPRSSSEYPQHAEVDGNAPQIDYSSANTPLQLLSEVAMGNSNGIHESGPSSARQTTDGTPLALGFFPGLANQQDNLNENAAPGYSNSITYDAGQVPGLPEAGLEAAMGDGFGQAMGMTLGDGDLSFMDDVFFNLNMEAVPNIFANFT